MKPATDSSVTISNVRKKSDGTAGELWVYGTSASNTTVPKLTGKGAWTSDQILAEYGTLIAPYAPDVVFYIIGANDIGSTAVATFKQNVSDFIDLVRATKPNAIVILISTPPSSSFTKLAAMPFILAARELAQSKACSFVDLWAALETIPSSYYRYDNIHFSIKGDGLVFNIIKRLILPNVPLQPKKLATSRESYIGAYGTALRQKAEDFSVVYSMGASPTVSSSTNTTAADAALISYKTSGGLKVFSVTAPLGFQVGSALPLITTAPWGRDIKLKLYPTFQEAQLFLCNGDAALDIENSVVYVVVSFNRVLDVLS